MSNYARTPPALPMRSSSRELGAGMGIGKKIAIAFGFVIGAGFGTVYAIVGSLPMFGNAGAARTHADALDLHHLKVQDVGNNHTHHDHDHHHVECEGGPEAACRCMLSCKVFHGKADECEGKEGHDRKGQLMNTLIARAMTNTQDACHGMRCIVECAQKLHCLDEKVKRDCKFMKGQRALHGCDVKCDQVLEEFQG